LTESVPASTGSAETRNSQSYIHARALRGHLESLDNIKRARAQIIERAQRVADHDIIKDRILQAAEGFDHLDEVKPVVFEDIMDEELAKYDKFLQELIENEEKQNDILASITVR
jgi:programmed cell death 6-interacting protein